MRRILGSIALVAVVVLAGCSGALPGGDDSTPALSDVEDPPGFSNDAAANGTAANGTTADTTVTNSTAFLETHARQIRNLSSYRYVQTQTQQSLDATTRVELDVVNDDEQYAGTSYRNGVEMRQVYYDDGTQYVNVLAEYDFSNNEVTPLEEARVNTDSVAFDTIAESGYGILGAVSSLTFEAKNTTTVSGETVVSYDVTGVTEDAQGVDNATGLLQVTPDGLVLRFSVSAGTPSGMVDIGYAITNTGSASVDTPAWYRNLNESQRQPEPTSQPAPQLALEFEERSDGHVEIAHTAGESVGSLQVRYTAGGEGALDTWSPEDGDITAGDTYVTTLPVDAGTEVAVIWNSEDGEQSVTIAEHSVSG